VKSSGKLSHAVKQPTDEKMERVASDAAHGAAVVRGGTTVYGWLKVNYEWEVYARTTTQGREFQIAATFLVPPLKIGKP
jgi:hypothetical protein